MKLHWLVLLGCATSAAASAQTGDGASTTPFRPTKAVHGVVPVPQPSAQALVGGSDSCSTADVITGTGAFAFDNSLATTGTEGQLNTNCIVFNQQGIASDVWFSWTAPNSGGVEVSTCGQTTVDTKIAVHAGACPLPNQGATPVACNDDMSNATLQTKCFFNAVAGTTYLIQLGTFPGAGTATGTGTFSIEFTPRPPVACAQWDDASTENGLRTGAAGAAICWLQRFGNPGDVNSITAIEAAWGTAFSAGTGGSGLLNGTATTVAIWDDPNDDGDPSDAVLLQQVATTVQNVDTDTTTPITLTPAVTANGVYFVGVSVVNPNPIPANWFPIPLDSDGCGFQPKLAWRAVNVGGTFNFTTLAANSTPPAAYSDIAVALANLGFNGVLLLRATCAPVGNGTPFCFGDGTLADHTTPCPCGNNGAAGNGCANSVNSNGANLDASGSTVANDVSLIGTGMPATVSCIYLQGDGLTDATFGDGVRCAGGTLIRLRTRANVAGASAFPDSTDTITLSARGGVTPGSGVTRQYQTYYRNSAAIFCPPETFNVTNGRQIVW
ncbi:MAG: hypothetical protein IPJ77_06330 [Planctomycetes bacterium]|nr:hypothetical protein [Planctomycetota bacterium]